MKLALWRRGMRLFPTRDIYGDHVESSLHVWRDCPVMPSVWEVFLPRRQHHQFFSAPDIVLWVDLNLSSHWMYA